MKIVTVLGARPQFIKAAPVSRALVRIGVDEVLVHTGQHFDDMMSDVFFREMGIPAPKHHLGIGGLSHGAMTGRMLEALEATLVEERPDWVLVYGDTNSTLAGALAAAKLRIAVAHVEAGLRSFNKAMPEEINRVVADRLSDVLFAPTAAAVANLRREGFDDRAILRTGDVMYDAAVIFGELAGGRSGILRRIGVQPKKYVLATIHRAENTDDPGRLRILFEALGRVAGRHDVVLPLHPRTRAALGAAGIVPGSGVHVIEPVGFLDMVALEREALLIATDSGGVQKEAYFHRVPCVTLREETEWIELVEIGANRLAPPVSAEAITRALDEALETPASVFARGNLYGRGDAAQGIAARLAAGK